MNPIKKSAQQMAQEPLELLKSVTNQVIESENIPQQEQLKDQEQPNLDQTAIAEQDGRRLEALESELKDIRRQKIFKDLMKRIQNGEDIPLEEFTELSYEQRDVLKAQIEAIKNQNANAKNANDNLPDTGSKRGRMMAGGQKQSAQQQTTRVEKPVPPSG